MTLGRFTGRGFKILAATAVASLVGVGTALHASADIQVGTGLGFNGTIVDTACNTGHCIQITVQFNGANNNNDLKEAFVCVAHAWPDASATQISTCQLETKDHHRVYSAVPNVNPPGPATAAVGGVVDFDLANMGGGLDVCYLGLAIFLEPVVGPTPVYTNNGGTVCFAPPSPV
ncbi:MAG TPA: hypothetical protein VGQ42_02705 [Candidatus Dormibacteraeota bacterium]|jgi:hypothetical protein|nr:hypothetical protein [Candidatus Dormibacteraeota bacterium]